MVGASDPTFVLAAHKGLRIGGDWDTREAWRFLSAQVARESLGLRQHVQRIHLVLDSDDPELLFGALVDLFLALGDKGRGLRGYMLDLALPHLADDQADFLKNSLDRGLDYLDCLPVTAGSVLDKAVMGSSHMIVRERQSAEMERDPVQQAIALLDLGHVDEARTTLEDALLNNPGNQRAECELLEIYRRTRDEQSFNTMRDKLGRAGAELSAAWQRF